MPRERFIKLNNLTRADGSALYSEGDTVLQVAIFGPVDVPSHRETPERATVEIVYKHAAFSKDVTPDIMVIQDQMKLALESVIYYELHPRSLISIIIQEIDTDGLPLATAINASCFGLMDASISMRAMVAAATVGFKADGSDPIVNPTETELEDCASSLTFVFESVNCETISTYNDGKLSREQFTKGHRLAREEAKRIFEFYRSALSRI